MPNDALCPQCGQAVPKTEPWRQQRFRWGMMLAALTFVGIGIVNAIQAISAAKTTGLGAVAGGFSETVTTFGLFAVVTSAVAGIILLVRGMSSANSQRTAISILGIVWFVYLLITTVGGLAVSLFLSRMQG